jgi:hypothetical protein
MFDPLAAGLSGSGPSPRLASEIVWFDAFVTNVDRTARNANMLMWHRQLQLIDHGAALYFHHSWNLYLQRAADPFTQVKDHVLLPFAGELNEADARMSERITSRVLEDIVALIPDVWLGSDAVFATSSENREAYTQYLQQRLKQPHAFVQEAIRARSQLV